MFLRVREVGEDQAGPGGVEVVQGAVVQHEDPHLHREPATATRPVTSPPPPLPPLPAINTQCYLGTKVRDFGRL